MTGLLQFAIVVLVQGTIICMTAGLLLRMFRKSAVRRHSIALTSLVLLLLCPALAGWLPSGWLLPLLTTDAGAVTAQRDPLQRRPGVSVAATAPRVPQMQQDHSIPDIHRIADPAATIVMQDSGKAPAAAVLPAGTTTSSISRSYGSDGLTYLLTIAVWIWLGGIVIALVQLMRRIHRLKPIRRSLRRIAAGELPLSILSHVGNQFAPRSLPQLVTTSQIPTPVVLGLFRPVVVLPEDLLRESDAQQLSDILIHECAHVARGDHWIHALQQLAGVVYWLHPGVQMLNRALATAREEVCDNYVLLQSDPTNYAQTLLDLTERCGTRQPMLSLLGLFSPRWSLESRIAGLLDPHRPRTLHPRKTFVTGIAILLGMGSLLTGGTASDASRFTSDTKNPAAQAADPQPPAVQRPRQSPDTDSRRQQSQVAKLPDMESADLFHSLHIQGYCEDVDGELIAGVSVAVYRYPAPTAEPVLVAQSRTDADGAFDFPDIRSRTDLSMFRGLPDLVVIASADGYAYSSAFPRHRSETREIEFILFEGSGTLSGTVTDPAGEPVSGATVTLHPRFTHPIPGFASATTDDNGRYEVRNLPLQSPKNSRRFFYIRHPDFATTRQMYSQVPQQVDAILEHPGIVTGQVIDLVTGKPVPGATVTAAGIARDGYRQVQTDATGSYRLALPPDHYNLWAKVKDRMPLAVRALKVTSGETTKGTDIRMSRGGFVTGRILDARGNPAPLPRWMKTHVAHHGPARPQTGHAVSSVEVDEEGRFRLHVAPGRNYVYVMSGVGSAWIDVQEGEEVQHDFTIGTYADRKMFADVNADQELADRLRIQATKEDEAKNRKAARHARWLAFPDEITRLDREFHRHREQSAQLERAMLQMETARLIAESPDIQRPPQDTATAGPGRVLQRWTSERLSRDFVQVSIGSNAGVTDGKVLSVFHQKKIICGIKVTHVAPDWSIGVVLKVNRRGVPRQGDRVTQGPLAPWISHR